MLVRQSQTALSDRSVALPELIQRIETRRQEAARPIVVGVSGYGGSGKFALTRQLLARLPGAARIRGDDFLDPKRSDRRSTDWVGVERLRLVSEVLEPVREGRTSMFRRGRPLRVVALFPVSDNRGSAASAVNDGNSPCNPTPPQPTRMATSQTPPSQNHQVSSHQGDRERITVVNMRGLSIIGIGLLLLTGCTVPGGYSVDTLNQQPETGVTYPARTDVHTAMSNGIPRNWIGKSGVARVGKTGTKTTGSSLVAAVDPFTVELQGGFCICDRLRRC